MKNTILLVLVLALGLTTELAKADFTFGTPTNLGTPVNSPYPDYDLSISADGLSLFFGSIRPGGYGIIDLYVTRRSTTSDPWGPLVNLGSTVNSPYIDTDPSLSTDGLSLFFRSHRPGGSGGSDLYVTTRSTTQDMWRDAVNLGPTVNTSYNEADPSISADGLSLYFSDYLTARPGGYGSGDIWVTTRATIDDEWVNPLNLGPVVNTVYRDYSPSISADGLVLFFDSYRPGGSGDYDLWVTTRKTIDDNWGTPVNLGPNVNSAYLDRDPRISGDGFSLYFGSHRPGGFGGWDLWQVPIIPIVDFNGDGIVDSAEMYIMVDHWGEYYPLCDIGPTPLGDGVIDVQDLIVLSEHLFTYPGAVAYWKLDETEGDIAYDSVGVYYGILNGVPTWQPTSGMIDGALELDGIDDYVSTDFVLNPYDGAFSVFAWIKGGAPGQVVISQTSNAGGLNWLSADPLDGKLMTELKGTGRFRPPLMSESVVTDGDWHRVGFVRDGRDRILYVDDIEVARDTTTNLESASGGLYIGAGSDLEPGSYWSGLIDDIRIYNRVVSP